MDLIADALLLAGALTAAFYCWVLSNRIKRLSDLDGGLGSAIGSLSAQVSEMRTALKATQAVTGSSVSEMEELVNRAEKASDNLRLMLAAVQEERVEQPKPKRKFRPFKAEIDLPDPSEAATDPQPPVVPKARAPQIVQPATEPEAVKAPDTSEAPERTEEQEDLENPVELVETAHEQATKESSPRTEPKPDVDENPPVILADHKTPAAKLRHEVEERLSNHSDNDKSRDDLVEALQKILAAGQ